MTCSGSLSGDFPDVNRYREILSAYDLSSFPKLKEKDVRALEDALSLDIPSLVKQVCLLYAAPLSLCGIF
jgi:hypothetical protein